MVDLKGDDDDSMDSALTQQVNAENSSKEDKLESYGSDQEKPAKRQEPAPDTEEKKTNHLKTIIIISVIALAVILLLALILSAVTLLKEKSRALDRDINIKEAKIIEEETAYITLSDSVDLSKLQAVEIVFSDNKKNQYTYNSSKISKEYEIKASSIGLSSFKNITSVSASFTLKSVPAPPVNNTNTSLTCTDSCTSLGKICGNWSICNQTVSCGSCASGVCNSTGQCSVSCSDQCASEGVFCQRNMRYNCSVGADRCLHRTNLTACGTGEQCSNGTCVAVAECSSNSTCFSDTDFTDICSIGFCNSTGKCQSIYNSSAQICRGAGECEKAANCTGSSGECPANINKPDGTACSLGSCSQGKCVSCLSDSNCRADNCYDAEFRDYFCNSTNGCEYNVITKEENLTNGNCNDRIDNDCDGVNDTANDPGCTVETFCGNNIKEEGEVCDGTDLDGKTCIDFDYTGGTLACESNCEDYDTWSCTMEAPSMSPFAKFWGWIKNLF